MSPGGGLWGCSLLNPPPVSFPSLQEAYPAVPPIWSVESDDPNLAAILERLVDVRKGNTLVRGSACFGGGVRPLPGLRRGREIRGYHTISVGKAP